MATTYLYQWSLCPRPDLRVELQVEAGGAVEARREVEAFLLRHGGAGWRIESVRRTRSERFPDALPQADLQGRLAATK